jgi:hypothetical protein
MAEICLLWFVCGMLLGVIVACAVSRAVKP